MNIIIPHHCDTSIEIVLLGIHSLFNEQCCFRNCYCSLPLGMLIKFSFPTLFLLLGKLIEIVIGTSLILLELQIEILARCHLTLYQPCYRYWLNTSSKSTLILYHQCYCYQLCTASSTILNHCHY